MEGEPGNEAMLDAPSALRGAHKLLAIRRGLGSCGIHSISHSISHSLYTCIQCVIHVLLHSVHAYSTCTCMCSAVIDMFIHVM